MTTVKFSSILTLTYPSKAPENGKVVKADLNRFLIAAKRHLGGFSYIWFLEFQARGAPHIHMLLSVDAPMAAYGDKALPGYAARAKLAHIWCVAIGLISGTREYAKAFSVHSHDKVFEALREENGAKRYIAKYASKPHQKIVPKEFRNVGRFWGASRDVREKVQPLVGFSSATEDEIRELLLYLGHKAASWEILPKYLWGLDYEKYLTGDA